MHLSKLKWQLDDLHEGSSQLCFGCLYQHFDYQNTCPGPCRRAITQLFLDDGTVTDVVARRARVDMPFNAAVEQHDDVEHRLLEADLALGMGLVLDGRDWVTVVEAARRRAERGEG